MTDRPAVDEAAERVAAYLRALPEPSGGPAWDEGENVARWGGHYLLASDLGLLLDERAALIAQRDAARDLAFRAAFADEVGAVVEAQWYADANPRHVGWIPYRPELWPETTAGALARGLIDAGVAFRRRTIGPWQAFTPNPTWRPVPAVPQEKS